MTKPKTQISNPVSKIGQTSATSRKSEQVRAIQVLDLYISGRSARSRRPSENRVLLLEPITVLLYIKGR